VALLRVSARFAGVCLVFGEAMRPTIVQVNLLAGVIVLGVGVFDCCRECRGRLFRCIGAWCDLGGVIGTMKASCLCGEPFDAGLLVVG
jgi:hypothetical protein